MSKKSSEGRSPAASDGFVVRRADPPPSYRKGLVIDWAARLSSVGAEWCLIGEFPDDQTNNIAKRLSYVRKQPRADGFEIVARTFVEDGVKACRVYARRVAKEGK